MYDFTIYWIKEEIASHYFLKSDILHRFLEEYQYNRNRVDLRKQFEYITNEFIPELVHSQLKIHLKDSVDIHPSGSYVKILKENKDISLHISKKELTFQSRSLQDAEEILFPILRRTHPLLFIVGHSNQEFGWISPIKFPRVNLRNQVLYSCQ